MYFLYVGQYCLPKIILFLSIKIIFKLPRHKEISKKKMWFLKFLLQQEWSALKYLALVVLLKIRVVFSEEQYL